MVTMLLGGLWHGASWNFVFWGGLHGVSLAIHKAWMAWDPVRLLKENFVLLLNLGLLFSSPNLWHRGLRLDFLSGRILAIALQYLGRLLVWSRDGTHLISPYIIPAIDGSAGHILFQKDRNWAHDVPPRSLPSRILAYSCLGTILVCLAATDSAPFIYFQF